MKVVGAIFFVSVTFMAVLSPALAGDAKSSTCELVPSHNNEESGDDRPHAMGRALIKYVEGYWDTATSKTPKNISVSRQDDPSGDGSTLDFYEVRFNSFQAGFYRYPDGTAMPSWLSTTSPKFHLPCGLKIGQSQKRIRDVLGEPTGIQQESFIYGTGGDQNGEVVFTFKRGKLKTVVWGYDTH